MSIYWVPGTYLTVIWCMFIPRDTKEKRERALLLLFSHGAVFYSLQPHLCSLLGLSVLHYLPEFAQTHVLWVHDTIQPSPPLLSLSSFCLQSCPASGSFPMSLLLPLGSIGACQSIGASASATVFPMNIQGWFPLGLTGLISLRSKGLSRAFSSGSISSKKKKKKHQFFGTQLSLWSSSHICTRLLEKPWKWKVKVKVAQSYPTVWDPMDCIVRPHKFSKPEYLSG